MEQQQEKKPYASQRYKTNGPITCLAYIYASKKI